MQTQTHTVSSVKIGVATGLMLVASAAAFAAAALPQAQGNGFSTMAVTCQDNSTVTITNKQILLNRVKYQRGYKTPLCQTSLQWQAYAKQFCEGKRSRTGKVGVKSFSVNTKCKVPFSPPFSAPAPKPPTYGYNPAPKPLPPTGYGYGYGYNPIPPTGYGYGYNVTAPASTKATTNVKR